MYGYSKIKKMQYQFFPALKSFRPVFWSPDFDVQKSSSRITSKVFTKKTLDEAIDDPAGIISGRNYASFAGYVDVSTSVQILDLVKSKINGGDLFINDLVGHSSGLPLVFLKSKTIGIYTSYSLNAQERNQLKRNVKKYGFGNKTIVCESVDSPGDLEFGSVAIVKKEIPQFNIGIETFLKFASVRLWAVIYVGSPIGEIQGWVNYQTESFTLFVNDSPATHITPLSNFPKATRTTILKKSLVAFQTNPEYIFNFYDDVYATSAICVDNFNDKRIETITALAKADTPAKMKPLTPEYMSELKGFILGILKSLSIDAKAAKELISDELFGKYWLRAFIHEIINANNNYESTETIGDSFLGGAFKFMIYDFDHRVKSNELTNITIIYTKKKTLSDYSRKLGLPKFVILGDVQITQTIEEDLLESFIGALGLAGEAVEYGYGFGLVRHFIENLMYQDVFGIKGDKRSQDAAKIKRLEDFKRDRFSIVETYKSLLGNLAFSHNKRTTGDSAIYEVKVSERGLNSIRSYGFNVSKLPLIYQGTNENPKIAKELAYEKLYGALRNIGFTSEFVESQRELKSQSTSPTTEEAWSRVRKIAHAKGYKKVYAKTIESASTKTHTVIILRAVAPSGSETNLAMINHSNNLGEVSEVNYQQAMARLLQVYLEKQV